jgi:hypothetical protein
MLFVKKYYAYYNYYNTKLCGIAFKYLLLFVTITIVISYNSIYSLI